MHLSKKPQIAEKHGGSGFALAQNENIWVVDGSEEYFLFDAVACGGESGVDNRCLVCDFYFIFWSRIFERSPYEANGVYSVPVSKLPDPIYATKKDLEQVGLVSAAIGHVGDGTLYHRRGAGNCQKSCRVHRIVHRAIEMDGTCSSIHLLSPSQKVRGWGWDGRVK